jgi:hypothetical protein
MAAIPPTPNNVSTAHCGRHIMKWGHGPADARQRISTIFSEELGQNGVTGEILRRWKNFYVEQFEHNPRNVSAAARVELIDHCLALVDS